MPNNSSDTFAPITAVEVRHLHAILDAAEHTSKMKWLSDPDADVIRTGIARRVGPFDGATQHDAPDLRDQYLHVSGTPGETWLPVRQVLHMLETRTLFFTPADK